MKPIHSSPSEAKPIIKWYKKAQVDYTDYFIKMYVAYNAWYREIALTTNDREALAVVKKRYIIWDDYARGKTMRGLSIYMERLYDLTQREPFMSKTVYWTGSLESSTDWRSLIEFWYQVRCRLVHGIDVKSRYVWLAYETLNIFMDEILVRMNSCLKKHELESLKKQETPIKCTSSENERFQRLQNKLYRKYVFSADIWQVDMQRVE